MDTANKKGLGWRQRETIGFMQKEKIYSFDKDQLKVMESLENRNIVKIIIAIAPKYRVYLK